MCTRLVAHTFQDSICDEADCAYSSKGKSSTSKRLTTWKAHDFVPEERCNYATRSADYQRCVLDPFRPRRNRHWHRMDVHALGCLDFGEPNVARSRPKFEGGRHGFWNRKPFHQPGWCVCGVECCFKELVSELGIRCSKLSRRVRVLCILKPLRLALQQLARSRRGDLQSLVCFFWWLAAIWGCPPIVTDNCQYIILWSSTLSIPLYMTDILWYMIIWYIVT